MMDENTHLLFRVTDLKEYAFCPRVVYYENCLPDLHPSTYKMRAGVLAHEKEKKRAARRTLSAYGLAEGERHFNVTAVSSKLRLSGELDEVVVTPKETIIVDYKLSSKVMDNFRLQVAAYALLLEDVWQCEVQYGFIYLLLTKRVEKVIVSKALRNSVARALEDLRRIVDEEHFPPATSNRKQCITCKHRLFCNDVL